MSAFQVCILADKNVAQISYDYKTFKSSKFTRISLWDETCTADLSKLAERVMTVTSTRKRNGSIN